MAVMPGMGSKWKKASDQWVQRGSWRRETDMRALGKMISRHLTNTIFGFLHGKIDRPCGKIWDNLWR
jgi:hypothetical protein